MKNTFYYTWLLALLFFANNAIAQQSQSHLWSLPNQQVNMTIPGPSSFSLLPVPIDPTLGIPITWDWPEHYDGRAAEHTHNSMHDENDDLLFFVIDGYIFNKGGYLLDKLDNNYDSQLINGNTEISIVPVPNHCNQYYIIGAGNNGNFTIYTVAYSKLDFDLFSIYGDGCRLGALENVSGKTSFVLNDVPGWIDSFFGKGGDNIYLAVTQLEKDNRFLYVSNTDAVFKYLITPTGITYDNYYYQFPTITALPSSTKGEMEIVSIGNDFRLACPFRGNYFSGGYGSPIVDRFVLMIVDIDGGTGEVIPGTTVLIPYERDNADVNPPIIKGLEFSPNGQYLYISHLSSVFHPNTLEIYDINNGNLYPMNVPNASTFDRSQIELGYDQSLYLANGTQLAQFINPDNPDFSNLSASWSPAFLPLAYTIASPFGTSEYSKQTYLLPDQIDGEDYLARYSNSTLCCKKVDGNACSYTAPQGTSVWNVNGANPFNAVQEVRIDNELRFPSGSTVYINNMTFRFEPNARMIIETNAKVYLNNTLLTSTNCDGTMWQGVSVDGNPNLSHANINNQGYFHLSNNSEISNAEIAVTLHKRDANGNTMWNNIGGIVQASNSTFRNNRKDVEFLTYNNPNKSLFSNCVFITDNQLNDGTILVEHVSMFNVNGVKITGCDFTNTTGFGQFYTDTQRGTGIRSINSYYKVNYRCASYVPQGQPCTNKDPNRFENLYYGINAVGVSSANSIEVMYNEFINNTRGAYFGALNNVKFVNNNINVGTPIWWSYGAYFDNCTGYKIQNNDFITSETGTTYGLLIANSNNNQTAIDANEVYRNTFTGFDYGAVAFKGNVQLVGGLPVTFTGLTFKCNTFSNSKINDIGFIKGISPRQGAISNIPTTSANNIFSSVIPSNGDFWNYDASVVPLATNALYQTNYYHPLFNGTDITTPQLINNGLGTDNNTDLIPCNFIFNMNSGCPINRFDGTGKLALKNKMQTFQQRVVSIQSFLTEVDQEVLEQIIEVQDEILEDGIDGFDDWEDFAEDLIDESPFVKDSHLVALFDLPIPGGVLKEILIANSPLTKTVLDVLSASPFPQGTKNQINSAQNGGVNARNAKEAEITYFKREQSFYFNEIIREYVHDTTIIGGLDSAIVLLKDRNTDADACALVGYYIDTKQFVKAQQQLDLIRLKDTIKYDSFCKLYELILYFKQTGNNCYSIKTDPVRKAKIDAIAAGNPKNKSCYRAQSILNEVYKFTYFEEQPIFPSAKSAFLNTEATVEEILASKMVIYPNPANDILTIELLLEREDIANVTLYDAMGRVALNKQVTNLKSYMDVSDLENGIYILIVELPNGEKLTDKIMIRK